jgi:zinc transport system substrate-binding protein
MAALAARLAVLAALAPLPALPALRAVPALPAAPPVRVAASIPPAAYFVERIGGAAVRVTTMVPAGSEEETYAPTPRQVSDMLRARLYVAVGHPAFPLESRYLLPLLRSHPEVRLALMSRGVRLIPMTEGAGDRPGAGAAGATDPHIWLAPGTVAIAARNIADGLVAVDPDRRAAYARGLEALQRDLRALDAAFRRVAAAPRPVRFLAYHPAWGYLARQYGFEQRAVEAGGKEPGTAGLVALIAAARRDQVRLVLIPPGFPPRAAEALSSSIDGKALVLDHLAHDWLANMWRLQAALAEAGGLAKDGAAGRPTNVGVTGRPANVGAAGRPAPPKPPPAPAAEGARGDRRERSGRGARPHLRLRQPAGARGRGPDHRRA